MLKMIKKNDTKDVINYQLLDDDGSPVNLTGATVNFVMGKKNKLITNSPAVVTAANDGIVEYPLTVTDTLVSGTFLAEFVVTFSNGEQKTFPNNGYITVNVEQNLDTNQTNVVVDMLAAKQGDFETKLNSILQLNNINITAMGEYTWTATEGQLVYTMPSTVNYTVDSKWFQVYVGNIPIDPSLVNRLNNTQFSFIVESTYIKAGMKISARWTEPVVPLNIGSELTAMNEWTWTATNGQLVYSFPENTNYKLSSKWFQVYVDNVLVDASLVQRVTDTEFSLNIVPSYIEAGMHVKAQWTESVVPFTGGHRSTHELGGQDSIDITKLTGYQENVATPLADIVTNVKLFGAKGDGVTDDTTAIQSALNVGGNIYFPDGVYIVNRPDSNTDYILTITKSILLLANGRSTVKVGSKANHYTAIIGAVTSDITVSVEKLKFDANGAQNPQEVYAGETRLTGIPHWRHNALWLEIGSMYLYNCEFRDFYGTQVALFWQNRENTKNSYVKVKDCRFLDIGDEYGQGLHDHSSIYIHKDAGKPKIQTLDVEVTGNVFKAKTIAAPNAICAIDLGGNNTICSNNEVIGYSTAAMIGTLDQKAKAKYHNNIFSNVSVGIIVWSDTHSGYVEAFDSSDYRYDELEFKNNNIRVTPSSFKNVYNYASNVLTDGVYPRYYCGVMLYQTATHKMKSLVIEDNFIQFDHDASIPTTGYKSGTGSAVKFVKSASTFSIDDVVVKNNVFKNISRIVVHFDIQFAKQLIVSNNEFIDVCLQGRQQVIFINQSGLTENRITQIINNDILSGDYSMYYFIQSGNNASSTDKYGALTIKGNNLYPATNPIDQYIYLLAKYVNIITADNVFDDPQTRYLYRTTSMGTRMSLNICFANGDELRDNRLILNRSAFPTVAESFSLLVGDTVVNTSPAASGYVGWVCNVAGNPGTWKGYGLIQA